MDFGIYPPEINSGRMYTGPGSGPVMAAAQAWGSLADELYTAASAYQSVVSELTSGSWSGPSSTSMTAAAGTYVEWLSATAAPAAEAGSGSTLSEMALAGMAGRAMAGTVGTGASRGAGKAAKGAPAPARTPGAAKTGDSAAAGDKDEAPKDKPRAVVTGVAAELREFTKLRDEGILTDEEYAEQKNRLLGR